MIAVCGVIVFSPQVMTVADGGIVFFSSDDSGLLWYYVFLSSDSGLWWYFVFS